MISVVSAMVIMFVMMRLLDAMKELLMTAPVMVTAAQKAGLVMAGVMVKTNLMDVT